MHPDLMPESANLSEVRTLSTLMVPGLPRHSMIRFRYEEGQKTIWEIVFPTIGMTLSAGREKSTSMPSPSRLKSSGTASALDLSRFKRLRGLMRRFNSSSQ